MRYFASSARIDFPFALSIALLLIISSAILYSVESRLFPLQWIYIFLGFLVFWLGTKLDKIVLEGVAPILYLVVILLLVATFVLGLISHGAVRWLPIGPITIQPSEFAKPILVLITAWVLSRKTKYGFWLAVALGSIVGVLVFVQPDLGTTLILLAAWFGTFLGSGASFKKILGLLFTGVLSSPLLWLVLAPYQKVRVMSFLSPDDLQGASYQSTQAMVATGSGGFFGRGLGQGSQTQLAFLPEHHTDFVFASIGEELGVFGMVLVLLSFFFILWRIGLGITNSSDLFVRAVMSGIFTYIFFQVFVNIGMNLGMLPIAGVPLPLVSAGGSALITTMFSLGIVVSLRKS